MWSRVSHHNIKYACTDGNKAYKKAIYGAKHVVSKSETCLVESFNAKLRRCVACLKRKTGAYAKSKDALKRNLKFFMFQDFIINNYTIFNF